MFVTAYPHPRWDRDEVETIERRLDEFYETKGAMYDKDTASAEKSVLFMVFAMAQEHMVTKLSQSGVDTRYVE